MNYFFHFLGPKQFFPFFHRLQYHQQHVYGGRRRRKTWATYLYLQIFFPETPGTGGDFKILWGRGWIPGVQTLRGKIGLRHMGGHG